ncbi:MAG: hypothetical protein IPI18_13715 [Saprospiraceae bacterium]|nr:hypothetical protein [Saprospiraceae bacterium]
MNKGISLSKGDFLIFLGADDVFIQIILSKIFSPYQKSFITILFMADQSLKTPNLNMEVNLPLNY